MKRGKMLFSRAMTSLQPSGGPGHRSAVTGLGLVLLAAALMLLTRTAGAASHAAAATAPKDSGEISETAAQKLADKMAQLSSPTPRSPSSWGPVAVTEAEANSYLRYRGYEFLPAAVHNPEIHIAADRVSGTADVDFKELGEMAAKTGDWGMRILAAVFRGKQRIQAAAKLETGEGQGKLTITSLTVGTTSIPPGFVNFILQSYMERQYKIDLSKPFSLPPHVTHIELGVGRATFHRSGIPSR
jgi:hypothetical protein